MARRWPILAVVVASCALLAHDVISTKVTYSREVVRIFQKRCFSCHQEGGKAFSLTTYNDARPWAKAIKEEVHERRMPPWGAVKGFGAFRDDQALTQEEISLIADWVEGGAPEGDPKYLPDKPPPDPPSPKQLDGKRWTIRASTTLKAPAKLIGIEPVSESDVPTARVYADEPDGFIHPVLWIRNYKAGWARIFELREPLLLPAGSRIRVEPPGATTVVLITSPGP